MTAVLQIREDAARASTQDNARHCMYLDCVAVPRNFIAPTAYTDLDQRFKLLGYIKTDAHACGLPCLATSRQVNTSTTWISKQHAVENKRQKPCLSIQRQAAHLRSTNGVPPGAASAPGSEPPPPHMHADRASATQHCPGAARQPQTHSQGRMLHLHLHAMPAPPMRAIASTALLTWPRLLPPVVPALPPKATFRPCWPGTPHGGPEPGSVGTTHRRRGASTSSASCRAAPGSCGRARCTTRSRTSAGPRSCC